MSGFLSDSSLSPLYSEQRRKRATPRRTPLPAGIPPVFFLSDGRPAVGEGELPRDHRPAVDRLDIYLSRPRCCSSPPGEGAKVCRRPQFVHSFCNGLEGMEFEPLWLVFLLLMVGVAASARWILLLRGFSSEISRLKSSERLGRVFSLPCDWISSLGMASMAVQVRVVLCVLLRCSGASRVEAEDGGWRVNSMRSTADVLFSRISCSLPLGVHLSICFGLIGGIKFLGDAWSPRRRSRFPVWRWKTMCRDLVVICAFLRVVFAKLGCTMFATVLI